MRSRCSKPARKHKVPTGGQVTQDEPPGIGALAAETQQVLIQAQRHVDFAAIHVVARLPIGNVKELRRRTQLLPQVSGAGVGTTSVPRGVALGGAQGRAQGAAKFEFLKLPFAVVRQSRQLVQTWLELRSRFRHRRAGDRPSTGFTPEGDGFFHQLGLRIMPREELGLIVHQLGVMGFEHVGDLPVQPPAGIAQ
jgi:hypothetical protein